MNTKQKGNNFEREMSRLLSLWWTNGKRDDAIWRSASSGALTTVGRGRYLAHTGDFAATDGDAELLFKHVIIEAKRGYNRYSFQDLLDVPGSRIKQNPVYEMLSKLHLACIQQDKRGMLLWKRDRRELLLLFWKMPFSDKLLVDKTVLVYSPPLPSGFAVMTWNQYSASVSGDRVRSLLGQPGASLESTLSIS